MLLLLFLLQAGSSDTLEIRTITRPPVLSSAVDFTRYGTPQVQIRTRQGTSDIWLLRAADTVFVAASIPDTSHYWGDDLVISLDTQGDGGPKPQHDDFQLYFRRALDSSVVFRGRNGRWEPPRDDPDWRLGRDRAGGGWEVSADDNSRGWRLLLRLDPAWFEGDSRRLPRIAFRIYDDAPAGWFAWPAPGGGAPANQVEQSPDWWSPVR